MIVQRTSALYSPNGTATFLFAEVSNSTFRNYPSLIKDAVGVVAVTDDIIPKMTNLFPSPIQKIRTSAKTTTTTWIITTIRGSPGTSPNRGDVGIWRAIEFIILLSNTFLLNMEAHPLASPPLGDIKGSPKQSEDSFAKYRRCDAFVMAFLFPRFLVHRLVCLLMLVHFRNECTSVISNASSVIMRYACRHIIMSAGSA